MKKYLVLTIMMLVILVAGCANKTQSQAWLTREVKINLPIINIKQHYHDQQLLKFKYNDLENSIIAIVDINNNQLKVIGLSALGFKLFEIDYDGKLVKTKHNIFIKELPAPEQVLSDIMLSILPIKEWQTVLPAGWQLIDSELHRTLINNKQEIIIDIAYAEQPSAKIRKPTQIKHHIFGYKIAIQSMDTK
ncbi:DUF3261 domain-containing protein [Gilliamella sp. ESL0250]|uniref:DUF3261 domain-containing protein n=1 Tax=Gilliamella sp. ESL0250 TaxID=2705036 RepID=UPI0015806B79|nr:DUF3261 domain-containing protein [Gilliamella sp. ESL0250]NUF48705.1 DUF3261 domain-containing protein [Gilliamella sp. ESL0250]